MATAAGTMRAVAAADITRNAEEATALVAGTMRGDQDTTRGAQGIMHGVQGITPAVLTDVRTARIKAGVIAAMQHSIVAATTRRNGTSAGIKRSGTIAGIRPLIRAAVIETRPTKIAIAITLVTDAGIIGTFPIISVSESGITGVAIITIAAHGQAFRSSSADMCRTTI
jgi:hypothetical protein